MQKSKKVQIAKCCRGDFNRPYYEEMTKNQNGITLIALIITIIVMMILVGVTVNVALNGGLFNTASDAKVDTQKEADKEELQSAIVAAFNAVEGTVDGTKLKSNLPEWTVEGEGPYICTSEKNNIFTVAINGNVENGDTTGQKVAITPTKETYTVGEEVTIGDEHFYVIADDTEKVTLLAKYNLNTVGTAQSNATTFSETACEFSSTNYWSTIEGITYPYDLNDTPTSADTDAIEKARTYGTNIGGKGRLLTREETETLTTNHGGIIYGTNERLLDILVGDNP